MLLRFKQLSLKQKIYKVFLPTFITSTFSISLYQGIQLRNNYLLSQQLETPYGPTNGVIKWVDETIITRIDKKLEELDRITTRIKTIKNDIHNKILHEIVTTTATISSSNSGINCRRRCKSNMHSTKNMIMKRSSLKTLQHYMIKERSYIPLHINNHQRSIEMGNRNIIDVSRSQSHDKHDINNDDDHIIPSITGMIRHNDDSDNNNNNNISRSNNNKDDDNTKAKKKNRLIRLLILGDSLVVGVGNDDIKSSPTLPQAIATMLCNILRYYYYYL